MESINFVFDGITSQEMGVVLVNINEGLQPIPFLPEQEIVAESVFQRDIPIYYGRNRKPLKLALTLASTSDNYWTFDQRRAVARWLSGGSVKGKFCEFYMTDDLDFVDKRWFLMYQGGVNLTHNGINQGYIEVEMQNISPYTYSPVLQRLFDFSAITQPTAFTFSNLGDLDLYPQSMEIFKCGNGDLSIINNSDGGREFKFSGLLDQEVLTIDNENRRIDTSLNATYRYDAFNGNYLKIVNGINQLEITGKCKINLNYRYSFMG